MRLIHVLTALLVMAFLYAFVFERDRLTGGGSGAADPAPESAESFAPPARKAAGEDKTVSVVATRSTARALDNVVLLRGQTEAARSVEVTAETAGRVVNDPLRKGAYVQAGEVLCRIDRGTRDATLAEAKAALSEAEVALSNAQRLNRGGYASDTQILTAQAGVERARAAVAQAERDIVNLEVKAPFAGLLESDTAELGTFLAAGSSCATVIQLDPVKLVGYAPEAEVDQIEVGAPAGARLLSGDEVSGRVTFLSRSADPTTRTFRVEVEIPNPDFRIRDGQTVELAIRAQGVTAHLVPQSALTLDDEGRIGLRLVGPDKRVEFAPVTVMRDTREGIWVTGLAEEAAIITVGQDFVRAGVAVDPHYAEPPQAGAEAESMQ
ncbi:efflux RND transporter periplasmic adaptor subunit [Celeribacter indicus]|uniref:Secretion protein HlyD n=1 Tax=Celeribacter indicus TaxID=1208324 RepID=A0A0B5DWI2_9RHOB|nr:efflux RND transporter periplasmic adaptor subunit [Celeribacter indicus]AJE47414.1 secretion protein HlyD [Celeribacter indicus]SDW05970.1 membrane fusion protein, multidrug efflux system [Celeribacter indicus]